MGGFCESFQVLQTTPQSRTDSLYLRICLTNGQGHADTDTPLTAGEHLLCAGHRGSTGGTTANKTKYQVLAHACAEGTKR